MKKFNLNDNFIKSTEVFAAKGIQKAVDPEKKKHSVSEKRTRKLILVDFWVQMNKV